MARQTQREERAEGFAPESIRERIDSLISEITQPGYHGGFTFECSARNGLIYAINKEVRETERS